MPAVVDLVRERGEFSSSDLAARLCVTRQTAHLWLARLVAEGALQCVGAGRSTRYRPAEAVVAAGAWPREALSEDTVWRDLEAAIESRAGRANVSSILHYALTKMVNNAIDHSSGTSVKVRLIDAGYAIHFDVEDDGVGIFEHVMRSRDLRTPFEAIAELQKGKVTTMPKAHSGEGIFFSSKMADRMTIQSGSTRWVIDARRNDQSVETVPSRRGTLVHFEIDKNVLRTPEEVFGAFADAELGLSRTRTSIKLFREGDEIISRSEARRLLTGLERFQEIELDFRQVRGIGQGFADEVFRVWQQEHPSIGLIVTNTSPAVRFMIDRARATRRGEATGPSTRPSTVVGHTPTISVSVGGSTTTTTADGGQLGSVPKPKESTDR